MQKGRKIERRKIFVNHLSAFDLSAIPSCRQIANGEDTRNALGNVNRKFAFSCPSFDRLSRQFSLAPKQPPWLGSRMRIDRKIER